MSQSSSRRAGAPFAALVILLGGWALVRAILWQSPFQESLLDLGAPGFDAPAPIIANRDDDALRGGQSTAALLSSSAPLTLPAAPLEAGPWMQQFRTHRSGGSLQVLSVGGSSNLVSSAPVNAIGVHIGAGSALSSQHQILFAAGFSYAPSAEQFSRLAAERGARAADPVTASPAGRPVSLQQEKPGRWSFDGWALWRSGSGRAFAAATPSPSYGASQAGAVLRYRISPAISQSPQAYVRATRALVTDGESEIAAGLSARPIARLPVRGHAEVRATRRPGATEIRTAAFATTEIPPHDLPAGLRASVYVQGGYVGGDFATAFVDGQMRLDRDVAQFDLGALQVGAGAWGGAQNDAARLDVGPSASIALDSLPVPARLSVDYRVRVAGDAQPGSGVALTLTTGF